MASDQSIPCFSDSRSQAPQVARQFPRFLVDLHCLYSKDQGPDCNGAVINLSQGGCAIQGLTAVQRGDYLRILIFPAPNLAPIEVGLAPVRWTEANCFGVEFITLTPGDAKRLRGYLMLVEGA